MCKYICYRYRSYRSYISPIGSVSVTQVNTLVYCLNPSTKLLVCWEQRFANVLFTVYLQRLSQSRCLVNSWWTNSFSLVSCLLAPPSPPQCNLLAKASCQKHVFNDAISLIGNLWLQIVWSCEVLQHLLTVQGSSEKADDGWIYPGKFLVSEIPGQWNQWEPDLRDWQDAPRHVRQMGEKKKKRVKRSCVEGEGLWSKRDACIFHVRCRKVLVAWPEYGKAWVQQCSGVWRSLEMRQTGSWEGRVGMGHRSFIIHFWKWKECY